VALALAGSLWGTGFLLGKIALGDLGVPHMILYRLLFASAAFVPVLLMQRPRIRRDDWPLVLLAGLFGVPLVFLLQFEGLARTTVTHASLMVAGMPILLGIAAAIIARERVTIRNWVFLIVSAVGALLIVSGSPGLSSNGQGPTVIGDGLVLLSLFAAVGWVLTSKRLMNRYDPSTAAAVVVMSGTVLLAIWVLTIAGPPPVLHVSLVAWGAMAAQGLLATTAAAMLWNWGVSRVPMSEAGVFVNLEPVVGSVLGMALLGDRLGWTGIIGGMLIVGAAISVTRSR
jgi:drug/metabolite transporter (DMT)-like permease